VCPIPFFLVLPVMQATEPLLLKDVMINVCWF
jgi:hypothetical protein